MAMSSVDLGNVGLKLAYATEGDRILNASLQMACFLNDIWWVRRFVAHYPPSANSNCLDWNVGAAAAAEAGHGSLLTQLMAHLGEEFDVATAFKAACRGDCLEIAQNLALSPRGSERCLTVRCLADALESAALYGRHHVVKWLIPQLVDSAKRDGWSHARYGLRSAITRACRGFLSQTRSHVYRVAVSPTCGPNLELWPCSVAELSNYARYHQLEIRTDATLHSNGHRFEVESLFMNGGTIRYDSAPTWTSPLGSDSQFASVVRQCADCLSQPENSNHAAETLSDAQCGLCGVGPQHVSWPGHAGLLLSLLRQGAHDANLITLAGSAARKCLDRLSQLEEKLPVRQIAVLVLLYVHTIKDD